jgi:hypothetical protein
LGNFAPFSLEGKTMSLETIVRQHLAGINDKRSARSVQKALEAMFDPDGLGQGIVITVPLTATDATRTIFIANRAMRLKAVSRIFSTASTSGAVTVSKDTGTTAPGGGTALLTGTLALSGTANTVVNGTLISTTATLQLAAGDRIAIVISGTMTNLVGGILTLSLERAVV